MGRGGKRRKALSFGSSLIFSREKEGRGGEGVFEEMAAEGGWGGGRGGGEGGRSEEEKRGRNSTILVVTNLPIFLVPFFINFCLCRNAQDYFHFLPKMGVSPPFLATLFFLPSGLGLNMREGGGGGEIPLFTPHISRIFISFLHNPQFSSYCSFLFFLL